MASPRYLFGSGASDFAIAPPSRHGGFVVSAASLGNGTLWSASTGGVRYTDLQTVNGGGTSTVSTDKDGGIVPFYGPAGVDGVWLDFGGGARTFLGPSLGVDTHMTQLLADPASQAGAMSAALQASAAQSASAAGDAASSAAAAAADAAASRIAAQAAQVAAQNAAANPGSGSALALDTDGTPYIP